MHPRTTRQERRSYKPSTWLASIAILGLTGTSLVFAQGGTTSANFGGFEIDEFGALFSGNGGLSGILAGDDWGQGASLSGVLDDDGNAVFPFIATHFVDPNWGNRGDKADPTKFAGHSNKNDDLIGVVVVDRFLVAHVRALAAGDRVVAEAVIHVEDV